MLKLIFVVLLIIGCSKANDDVGTHKAQELRSLSLDSPQGIINLNSTGYQYYVLQSPRPYDLVIFYTSKDCKLCETLEEEYNLAAGFYRTQGGLYPDSNKKPSVFFAKMTYQQDTIEVYRQNGFQSVPNLMVSPKRMAYMDKLTRQAQIRDFTWQISNTDGHITSTKLLEYLNKKTGRNVEYKESVYGLFLVLIVFIGILIVFYFIWSLFKPILLNTKVQFVVSLFIYSICMAGVVYNILHQTPFTLTDRQGNLEWYSTQGRSQYGAEGFVMSFIISIIGVLFVLVIKVHKLFNSSYLVSVIQIGALLIIYNLVLFVEDIYRKKSWQNIQNLYFCVGFIQI